MPRPRPRLTLIDLMAAIGAAALGLALMSRAAPGQATPTLMVIAPLVAILWDRRCGGRGILGGALGGFAYAAISLPFFVMGPLREGIVAHWPEKYAGATVVCVAFGTMMGVTTWLAAAAMGRSVMPHPPEPSRIPSGASREV